VWLEYSWYGIFGDFRLYALATTASGECYSVRSTLLEALMNFYEAYYVSEDGPQFPKALLVALESLKQNDGSRLRPKPAKIGKPRVGRK
jgi:hypothetical protein